MATVMQFGQGLEVLETQGAYKMIGILLPILGKMMWQAVIKPILFWNKYLWNYNTNDYDWKTIIR
ncbi:hypothetical protein KHA80_00645 [Anaerobacillus sp. HL2]|nr:hypothetical protein KHA80_00645 [Anaerobacillus sp. HL2]